MQNEFEKQVQQKMSELDLNPSEPVWNNIREVIRKKRDRRRLLLWFPLFCLLIAGGVWYMVNNNENEIPLDNVSSTTAAETKESTGNEIITSPEFDITKSTIERSANTPTPKNTYTIKEKRENVFQSEKPVDLLSVVIPTPGSTIINSENGPTKDQKILEKIIPLEKNAHKTIAHEAKDTTLEIQDVSKETIADEKINEIKVDSPLKKKIVSVNKNNWKIGVTAGMGLSGIGRGFFSMMKSFDATASPQNPTTGSGQNMPPSEEKNGISFSAGLALKKSLSKRFSLTTGINYNYYSTSIQVGQNIRRDTIISSAYSSVRVNQFYTNSANNSTLKKYTNGFHFLSIPVGIDFQLLKNMPLQVSFGLSLQQLVGTNAMMYEPSTQVYYSHPENYNRTQLFTDFSLSYTFFNNKPIPVTIGPSLQYSLSSYNKYGSDRHLYSLGLKGKIFFK